MYFTAQAKQKYQKVCLNLIFSNWFKFSTSPASPHICNFNITVTTALIYSTNSFQALTVYQQLHEVLNTLANQTAIVLALKELTA